METEISKQIEASVGSRFSTVMGKRPWEINLQELSDAIQNLPWIQKASVTRALPDRLVVSIRPKIPLAVIVDSEASGTSAVLRPVAEGGELMPVWDSNVIPDVPFLRGARFRSDLSLRKNAVRLMATLPSQGILDRSNLAEMSFTDSTGFSILLSSPRTEIQLGHLQKESDEVLTRKIVRVGAVLNYLSANGKKARVIDSTSVKKVVVRAQHRP